MGFSTRPFASPEFRPPHGTRRLPIIFSGGHFDSSDNVQPDLRMAGRLSTLLDPSRIRLHILSNKRTIALNEVARLLDGHPDVTNFQGFYNELLARERLDTTCLGNEIALPHARTEHVQKIVMAVGRSDQGVLFENSNQTVKLMFVLGTPKSNPTDYLQVVSALCKIFKDPANRDALARASTPEDFIQAIVTAEEKLLNPVA
jgi:mannitol/fructose-specific phosphotransferase system IIA component (Ntr-type)